MTRAGWVVLAVYAVVAFICARWVPGAFRNAREEWRDFGPGVRIVVVLAALVMVPLIGLIFLLPLAAANGWNLDGSRPDGCYRQVTEWSAATKTNRTDYEPVPCPEQVVP